MRGRRLPVTLFLLGTILTLPAAAMTVDEVIAKHIEARGGDRWSEIRSIKLTGSATAFSEVSPFTLLRKQGDKYRIQQAVLGSDSVVAFDGKIAWNDRGRGPSEITGLDLSILMRDVGLTTPLFDYEARGFTVKLLGEVDFDGMRAIGIELTRDDESVETWYLDPDSYLDIGLDSPGSDYLGPVDRRTFFDEFREVEGVMLPHYVEAQWYTRSRILEVQEVVINPDLEDALFSMPLPPGMNVLAPLVGSWTVTIRQRNRPDAEWQESERGATIDAHLRGGMLQESYRTGRGVEVVRTYSYDKFNEEYRVTQIDGDRTQMNVQEGTIDDDGKITVSNVDTGTGWSSRGRTFHGRLSIVDISEGGFKLVYEQSVDGGENWFTNAEAEYTRADD